MDSTWWSLPGPGEFVDGVVSRLRSGLNVVIDLPRHAPGGMRRAIAARIREDEITSIRYVDLSDLDDPADRRNPARLLHRRFAPLEPGAPATPRSLATSRAFGGGVTFVSGLTADDAGPWSEFLAAYSRALRNHGSPDSGTLCVAWPGALAAEAPAEDAALDRRRWEGAVDPLDMLLYCARVLPGDGNGLYRRTAHALIAELAGTDPHLVQALAPLPIAQILAPRDALRDFARERGWTGQGAEADGWAEGWRDRIDGSWAAHSAWLAASANDDELSARLWRAEVSVLLPYVEERRREYLQRFAQYLKLPMETKYGVIRDIGDLEIGHLLLQVHRAPVSPQIRDRIWRLSQIRNHLAHLEAIRPELLAGMA